jgi:hypothetical protein
MNGKPVWSFNKLVKILKDLLAADHIKIEKLKSTFV